MSKLAIISLVLGILSLFFFVLAGIPAIVIGILSILTIRRSGGQLKGKYIALVGINVSILFMCVFYLLWRIDAPPIPNDYTIADLRSAPAKYAESFEVLKTLLGENDDSSGFPAIELASSDTKMIAEIKGIMETAATLEITKAISYYTEEINQIWADNETARDIIHRLNEFPEIADLTELNANLEILPVVKFIDFVRFYQVYGHLKIEQQDTQSFVNELIELDSVCRKLSVNARMFVPTIAYHICINENILTANALVNDKQTPMSTVDLLAGHFTPLTNKQTSLRNSILSEYLLMQNFSSEKSEQSAIEKILRKKNSTLRLFRNCYDRWLDAEQGRQNIAETELSVWPDIYPFKGLSVSLANPERLPLLYRVYNPQVNIINMFGPFDKTIKSRKDSIIRMQIHDDLLQIVLNKRLGKGFSLKARVYGDEYVVDVENRKIFSPGPDGKLNTKDDIFLPISPEVMGWKN
ncbi:MAG: DUF4190 domain-containing protein [Sedimentisphaerales bacterium]|nr:DUF4190 domain-containing protein [Sedimentisphaerales bacterium]